MSFCSKCLASLVVIYISCRSLSADEIDFENTAALVISKRCIECHNAVDRSGELDLTRLDTLMAGGASGAVITPGDADASELISRIAAGEMPPPKNGKSQRLPEAEIELFAAWINAGAPWPDNRVLDPYDRTNDIRAGRDWWSLQLFTKPSVPISVTESENPIDGFVAARLNANGLTKSPRAGKRDQIRRLYFDLIGLPPSAENIEAFIADASSDAYEKIVDRLLAMRQFGERWARHWLDIVRYADTNGYERDAEKPNAWRYRDWVVNAFNNDMPYDRFVMEQLAGDELPDRNESTVIATGFIRLGTWDDEPNDTAEYQYERLEDLVHATSTAFLGLTVKCARCHDHKFDPIYQSDYYRMGAAFWPGPVAHRDRALLGGPTKEELGFDVLGWTDLSNTPAPLHSLKKGDIHRPIQVVGPGPLSSVPKLDRPFHNAPAEAKTTQRRLQLAQWMVQPENPLTSRVLVNRIWQHHFGEGLVRTPDNFGFNGQPPTHPELLDWLASDLVENGWKMKRIHKLMVMSETYRQSSLHPKQSDYVVHDSPNRYLWRANRARLDAESLRDAVLSTSGQLDLRLGGPSFRAPISDEALEGLSTKGNAYQASEPSEARRRSLYIFNKRGLMVPMMTTFDICDSTMPSGRRESTIVATQALAMLNNGWIHEQSTAFADRVIKSSPETTGRINNAWRYSLGRLPSERERTSAVTHLSHQRANVGGTVSQAEHVAWVSLCHVLVNTNEFIYLD